MGKQKNRRAGKWLDPNKVSGRRAKRYCKLCETEATQVRILKNENICENCVKALEKKKDGIYSCKACGKVVPKQVQDNNGYCKECVCRACGKAEPKFVQKHGFCEACFEIMGTNCRKCGKEAYAQVQKNDGLCDKCAGK